MAKETHQKDTHLLVVPHTHWDREWHQTFQQFRLRLVRAVDLVLDTLERDPNFAYFMLDGQTVVLEDYLEVRSENAERLQSLARQGRLLVGPWYVQPDEFLAGGEALIRNLQIGRRMAEPYGGAMPVGYLPDSFGHIAQLPQLLRGFGLDNAVLWRGVGPEITQSEFCWAAPDGSEVLVIWLGDEYGYSNAANLPLDAEALVARVQQIAGRLRQRTSASCLLLMNGSDHLEPQVGLPAALAAANARLRESGLLLHIGTLPWYVEAMRETGPSPQHHTGELRSGYWSHLLSGVLSTRVWLKQRNAACEAVLVRWAEPTAAWAWVLGSAHPTTLLGLAWKYLLLNHAHDSICGCGIDQVHREMLPRFDQSEQIADELTRAALCFLVDQVKTRGPAHAVPVVLFNAGSGPRTEVVSCRAQLTSTHIEVVDADGHILPHEVLATQSQEVFTSEVESALIPAMLGMVSGGRVMGHVISDVQLSAAPEPGVIDVEVTALRQGEPDVPMVERMRAEMLALAAREDITAFRIRAQLAPLTDLLVLARDVPAYGGRVVFLRPAHPTHPAYGAIAPAASTGPSSSVPFAPGSAPAGLAGVVRAEMDRLENEHLLVRVDAGSGTLALRDKRVGDKRVGDKRGAEYAGLNRIVDSGDVGDLYTFCPPAHDRLVTLPSRPPTVETLAAGPLRATLRVTRAYALPAACDAERTGRASETVTCTVTSDVTLDAGSRRVDIRTTVENTARDHRLRLLFPVPFPVATVDADGTFTVTRRPALQPSALDDSAAPWAEPPVNTHPHKRFVDMSDGESGLAVLTRGLVEHEVVADASAASEGGSALALTLLRCVEWLSRGDLTTRRGHAGPMLRTPEAQGIGTHVFEYALVPHQGSWYGDDALALCEAQAFEAPLRALATDQHAGRLPADWSFVRVAPAGVVLSMVKRAERGDGVVVRLYNTREVSLRAVVTFGLPLAEICTTDLDEEPLTAEPEASRLDAVGGSVMCELRPGEIKTLLARPAGD
jgi:alpha-mannosidase